MLAAQPTKQFVTVDQVAALAVYLCSDAAAADHRRQHLDRRRLDGGMSRALARRGKPAARRAPPRDGGKTVNLALQGGGSHGAFTWGVLDALAEDGRLEISGDQRRQRRRDERRRLRRGHREGGRAGRARGAGEILAVGLDRRLARAGRSANCSTKRFRPGAAYWPAARLIDAWTDAVSPIR